MHERSSSDSARSECPSAELRVERAPDVRPAHDDPKLWLAKLGGERAEAVLVGEAEQALLARIVGELPGGWRDPIDARLAAPEHVDAELSERLEWLRGRVRGEKYVEGELGALEQAAAIEAAALPVPEPEALRYVTAETPLWCVPTRAGLYTPKLEGGFDRDFDRNRCSSLHFGELVRVIRKADAWIYVDAGHSVGWLYEAALTPALTPAQVEQHRSGERVVMLGDQLVPERGVNLRAGTSFRLIATSNPKAGPWTIEVPGASGLETLELPAGAPARVGPLPLTRTELFEQAFTMLDQPYGWGGRAGERDCSRYLLDLFAQFGVRLPRNSAVQSKVGTTVVELAGQSDADKLAKIRAAAEDGAVLLYMPGHILLYLGHDVGPDGREQDYGISSLSDFLVPCPGGPDTVHRIDRVAVTTLELGRGSERRAFIERIERMAVFAPLPRDNQ